MDIKAKYLGYELQSPFVLSASPISQNIDNLVKLNDLGIGAIVLHSLFEEQLIDEQLELEYHLTHGTESFAEAQSFFPNYDEFRFEPDEYLELIRKAKERTNVPIIGSLNGTTLGGWISYAKQMEEAGADAIELNIYNIPTDFALQGDEIEDTYVQIFREVKTKVHIPVAAKLSPFFTNFANFAKRLDYAGANALVLFNRFYQPDINIDTLEVEPKVSLSTSADNRVALRWIAMLKGRINLDLAATGGILKAEDAIKALLAGANVVEMFSIFAWSGIDYLTTLINDLQKWMMLKEYSSVSEFIGTLSQEKVPNPSAYERAQYMKALMTYEFH
ncbi:MAG: dihydroorotate dehydrogenase-like protein [Candidatus Kapabacteria bacterium]|nr:dihydroorotate dehydrogenase-like protein [Candidatus Kapabacteria bacterium]